MVQFYEVFLDFKGKLWMWNGQGSSIRLHWESRAVSIIVGSLKIEWAGNFCHSLAKYTWFLLATRWNNWKTKKSQKKHWMYCWWPLWMLFQSISLEPILFMGNGLYNSIDDHYGFDHVRDRTDASTYFSSFEVTLITQMYLIKEMSSMDLEVPGVMTTPVQL